MRIIGITGWSGAGKTSLLVKILPVLRAHGLTVSTIKHAHHAFDVDVPGKDSHEHRVAGASEVLISSGRRFALMHELRDEDEWTLEQLLAKLTPVDLVIVEGFKRGPHPKIEVFRQVNAKPALYPGNATIKAVAADCPLLDVARPVLALDDIKGIAAAMLAHAVSVDDIKWGTADGAAE